jgi:arabinogalactan oligomer / maltooligosaccharide transport system substrate-binding protein
MKRTFGVAALSVALFAGAALSAPSAKGQEATTTPPPTTTTTIPARGDNDLVIWADETKVNVIKPLADAFAAKNGIKIAVQELKFEDIRDQLKVAGPAGKGPDVIIAAHDWLGDLATNGLVEPLDLGAKAKQFAPVSVKAMTYGGKLYGVPYAIENVALIRNTKLVPKAPKTFAELEKVALALKKSGKVKVALALQNSDPDPYHDFPLFTAMGGYVFKADASGSYDANQLGIDSKGGLEAARQFRKWVDSGLIDPSVTYDVMVQTFGDGQAPFAITGPWAVNDKEKGFKAKGVPYVIEPIPPVKAGVKPAVFVGVQGFMVSSFSKQKALAKTFVIDELTGLPAQTAMFGAGGRPPANLQAFKAAQSDPDVKGFGLSGQNGLPMPALPAMGSVWSAWTDGYKLIFTKQGTPEQAFKDAATKIRALIASK